MNLVGRGCCILLLFISSNGHTKIDPYYSQAIDIDYALEDENEPLRISLIRMLNKLLGILPIDTDKELIIFTPENYYGQETSDE